MEELKYGNTLVSSRKDETLTYAKYVRDLTTGKSVEETLSEIRTSLESLGQKTIPVGNLDTVNQWWAVGEGKPSVYSVTDAERNVGVLLTYGNKMDHVIVQILQTQMTWSGTSKSFDSHTDGVQHTYYRVYNLDSSHLDIPRGNWSEWKPYLDSEIDARILAVEKSVKDIGSLSETEISNAWNNAIEV